MSRFKNKSLDTFWDSFLQLRLPKVMKTHEPYMNFQPVFFSILIFYLIATVFYLLRLIVGKPIFSVIGLRLTLFTALLQAATLLAHVIVYQRPFFTSYLDYFQTSALVLALLFVFLCFTKKFYASGPLFITLIDVLCIFSLTYPNPYILATPVRGQGYLIFHISTIFLSLSVFAIGLVSAILFLLAERSLKKKRFDGWVANLPPLESLDEVHYKALYVGFILFTFAIITGAGFSKVTTGHYIAENLKQILSILLWFFFAVLLNFRVQKGWQGHKGILLSLIGFAGMGLLFFVGLK